MKNQHQFSFCIVISLDFVILIIGAENTPRLNEILLRFLSIIILFKIRINSKKMSFGNGDIMKNVLSWLICLPTDF
jgi:hypothetical protein